jgi:type VI protein secretion system component Hcp
LERRVLLAASFPAPAVAGTFDGGWDLVADAKAGELPSTLDGKTYPPGSFATYSLEIDGQTGVIPLESVSFGDSAAPGASAVVSDIIVTAPRGKYSTGMLEAVGVGAGAVTMTIHQKDAMGRDRRLWIMDEVLFSSFTVGDSAGDSSPPSTSFALNFTKITLKTIDYTAGGMALPPRSVVYDRGQGNHTSTGIDFGGEVFSSRNEPEQLLDLGTGQVAIDSFSWGVAGGTVVDNGSDRDRGAPGQEEFRFTAATGAASLGLLSSVYLGKTIDSVTFTTRDDSGRVVADWKLQDVIVTAYQSTSSPGGSARDEFHLQSSRVEMVRHSYDTAGNPLPDYGAGWDFTIDQAYGTLPATLAGNNYPPTGQPALTMQIDGSSQVIPVQSYTWGEGQAVGGMSAELGDFALSIPQGAYSTGMLQETLGDLASHDEIDLISRDGMGREVMRWVLTGAYFDHYASSADQGDGRLSDVVELAYSKLKAIHTSYDKGTSQVEASYEIKSGAGTGAALSGNTYPTGSEPALGLEVGGTTIPVDSYALGLSRGANRPAGQAKTLAEATPVSISVAQGAWSPGIFASVAVGSTYPEAELVSRDPTGRVTARWKFSDLHLTSYSTSALVQTIDAFSIGYTSIERVVEAYDSSSGTTSVYAGGYDLSSNLQTPAGDTLGSTLKGVNYATGDEPEYTLSIAGTAGLIPVNTLSWGDAQPPAGSTAPVLNQFSLIIPAGAYDTGILEDVGTGGRHAMTLTRRDAQGRAIMVYRFTNAKFTLLATQGSPGQILFDQVVLDYLELDVDRIAYAADGSGSTKSIHWDIMGKSGTTTDRFGGQFFAPGSEPEMVLDLGTGQTAVTGFAWGATQSNEAASAGDFTISAPAGPASLGLISSPLAGTQYEQALLTTRDTGGHIITQWRLKGIEVTTYSASDGPGSATDTATFSFESIELIYNAYAPAVAVDAVPTPRNTAVPSLTFRFSEPVTSVNLSDLRLTRNGGGNLLTAAQTLTSSDGGQTWTLGNLSPLTGGTDGVYTLTIATGTTTTIYGTVTGEPLFSATPTTWVLDRVAPAIAAAALDYSVNPNRIRVTFGEDVKSLSKDDLVIKALGAGAPPAPAFADFSYDSKAHVAVWTFASPLPDGNYSASLAAGSVTDLAGNPIGSATFDFFSLAGDANHDRTVDFNDLVALAQNYNTSGKTFAQGDFNYDGSVDFNDLVILAQRYNTTLAMPGGAAAASDANFAIDWAAVTTPSVNQDVQAPGRKAPEKPKLRAKSIFNVHAPIAGRPVASAKAPRVMATPTRAG